MDSSSSLLIEYLICICIWVVLGAVYMVWKKTAIAHPLAILQRRKFFNWTNNNLPLVRFSKKKVLIKAESQL